MRDPKVDPKAGDVLAKGFSTRWVDGIRTHSGWSDIHYHNGKRRIRCYTQTWREWAKNAEVIHHAGE